MYRSVLRWVMIIMYCVALRNAAFGQGRPSQAMLSAADETCNTLNCNKVK